MKLTSVKIDKNIVDFFDKHRELRMGEVIRQQLSKYIFEYEKKNSVQKPKL